MVIKQLLHTAGAFVLAVFFAILLVRRLPSKDPVSISVENHAAEFHAVEITVVNDNGVVVYDESFDVDAHTSSGEEEALTQVAEYYAVATLDDGSVDSYKITPLTRPIWRSRMHNLVVSIDGELGHFTALGAGGYA